MLSKKHYVAVAAMIAEQLNMELKQQNHSAIFAIMRITRRLASIYEADNPAFDRERFYEAAEITQGRSDA